MSKKKKYYTVWEGLCPGVYDNWAACELQIKGIAGAKYKSFDSQEQAEIAYRNSWREYIFPTSETNPKPTVNYKTLPKSEQPILDSVAVDAACSGNPGKMEYQGVDVKTGFRIFHYGPLENGTNNIGEFLAIVHALGYFSANNPNLVIYSDSKTAIAWIKNKVAKTKLIETADNKKIFELIARAEKWLKEHSYSNPILKWDTEKWGEIPADFGRK